jgi:hypothetical protein
MLPYGMAHGNLKLDGIPPFNHGQEREDARKCEAI